MTKGKPWPVEDEKQLTSWYTSGGKDLQVLAFSFDGKYSENTIYQKLLNLEPIVKEEETRGKHSSSSSSLPPLKLPDELPSVEETLKTLATALKGLEDSRLKRNDILWL